MESVERVEQRARVHYEFARMRRALLGFAPVLAVVAAAALLAKHPSTTVAFGIATFAAGTVLLWYGRDLRRAVLPGVAAGFVPLVLALCANHVGHACMGDRCMALCVPLCATGGAVAGFAVAAVGIRRRSGIGFWLAASALALLTGAMGCSGVGYAGLVGLALGFGGGVAFRFIGRLVAKRPRVG
jgi:hypothetical protein